MIRVGLTLREPWGSLIAIGAKKIETRSWGTSYRGRIAISVSKWRKVGKDGIGRPLNAEIEDEIGLCLTEPFRTALVQGGITKIGDLPSGMIIATATVVDCREITPFLTWLPANWRVEEFMRWEHAFGNYASGRFAWFLEDVRALAQPIPAFHVEHGIRKPGGALGLWTLPEDIARQLEEAA